MRGRRPLRSARDGVARETTFVLGGSLVIAMGVAFMAGLWWSGAGWGFAGAWLGAILAVGFGVFFVQVGRGERQERLRFLRSYDAEPTSTSRPPR
jgi:hypothetical protein